MRHAWLVPSYCHIVRNERYKTIQLLILSLEQLMISKRNVSALGPKTHVASILIQSITVLYSQAINKLFIFMF